MELVYESFENKDSYDDVLHAIDAQWIEESLFATKKASIRRRRLPEEQAVWLIIMMGLMRNSSIKELSGSLDIPIPMKCILMSHQACLLIAVNA